MCRLGQREAAWNIGNMWCFERTCSWLGVVVFWKFFGSDRFHCDDGMMPLGYYPFLLAILFEGGWWCFFCKTFFNDTVDDVDGGFKTYSPENLHRT